MSRPIQKNYLFLFKHVKKAIHEVKAFFETRALNNKKKRNLTMQVMLSHSAITSTFSS